jgi:hypothetical protein
VEIKALKFSERRDIVLPLNFYSEPHEFLRKKENSGMLAFALGFRRLIT